jgi:peptidoglycan/xylan/chitin deacetylase (PgdA/CDA1 family)
MKNDFRLLSKEELGVMASSDLIEIGAHTVNHQILSWVDAKVSKWEIVHSKVLLHELTGKEIDLFAYPNGGRADYSDEHVTMLKDNGFICSVTLEAKLNDRHTDPYRLGRICVGPDFSANTAEFAMKTSGFNFAVKSFMDYTHV